MAITRYRQVLEQLDDGVFFTNMAGVVTDCNAGAEGLCGVGRGEIIGRLLEYFHLGPGLSALMPLSGDADPGDLITEVSIARPDGETRLCTAKLAILRDDDEQGIGFVCIYRVLDCAGFGQRNHTDPDPNLVQRFAARDRELEQARSRLQHLVSASPAALYTCRASGDFAATYVSPNVLKMTGYCSADFTAEASFWLNHVHPDDQDHVLSELGRFLQRGEGHAYEYRFRKASGVYLWMRDEMNLVAAQGAVEPEIVGYWTDITERKQTELALREAHSLLEQRVAERTQELNASNARLAAALEDLQQSARKGIAQERMSAIGEVASGISHNLNNMLSPSVILIDLLQTEPDLSERAQSLIKTIKTSTHDAAELVSRLGLLYRNTDAERKREAVDLRALIEEIPGLTSGKWRHEARRTGREIDLKLQLEDVPAICGNAADLRQCLTNLVFNAVDAMTHGGTIHLRLRNEDGAIVVTVRDCGRGMTDAEQDKCLEPFFTTKASGTGLGLPLCAGIVAEHRGTLQLESAPCEGTLIHLRFPVESRSTPGSTGAIASEASCSAESYRILYIDDEPLVRKSMSLLLDSLGRQVELAENGFAGVEKFEQQSYDLVISDYSMPGRSGREVAAAVKAINPATVVLLVTGWPASHIAPGAGEQAFEDGIIQKPITVDKLRAALGQAMLS